MYLLKRIFHSIFIFLLWTVAVEAQALSKDRSEKITVFPLDTVVNIYQLPTFKINYEQPSDNQIDTGSIVGLSAKFNLWDTLQVASKSIHCLGFNEPVKIYLNKNLISRQYGGYQPFTIKIPNDFFKNGINVLEIIFDRDIKPGEAFYPFAHVFGQLKKINLDRPLTLSISTHSRLLNNFSYTLNRDKNNGIEFSYSYACETDFLDNYSKKDGMFFVEKFLDPTQRIVSYKTIKISEAGNQHGRFDFISKNLWTPEKPQHIAFVFQLKKYNEVLRSDTLLLGIRDLHVNNTKIFLNFALYPIKGIDIYPVSAGYGQKPQLDIVKQDLQQIKSLGFNAVRFAHFIPDLRITSIADTLGLLLFIELPVNRYPSTLFQQDNFLEICKNTLKDAVTEFAFHPSFAGISLGQAVPLSEAYVQKFFLILNGSLPHPAPYLSYLAPVPAKAISSEMAADFYSLDIFGSYLQNKSNIPGNEIPFTLAGNVGMSFDKIASDVENEDLQKRLFLQQEIYSVLNEYNLQGGFVTSFKDWYSRYPTSQTINNANNRLIPTGIVDSTNSVKTWFRQINGNAWNAAQARQLNESSRPRATTNAYSIVLFLGSIIFFFFYRRYPRFSENYGRALRHPYGFYVDMRERRIIPVFNSFVVGVYNSFIVAVFISSYIYYFNNSYFLQEIVSVVIPSLQFYDRYLKLSQSPFALLGVVYLLVLLHPLLIGLVIKFFNLFTRSRLRSRQALGAGLWAAAPFVFMLPISIATFQLLGHKGFAVYMAYIFLFFLIWTHFRLINGVRVLMVVKARSVFIFMLLSYIFPLVIFWAFFNPQPMWLNYISYLVQSFSLF